MVRCLVHGTGHVGTMFGAWYGVLVRCLVHGTVCWYDAWCMVRCVGTMLGAWYGVLVQCLEHVVVHDSIS